MVRLRRQVALLVGLLSISFVVAGVVPGRWEKVDAQPRGTSLIISGKTGEEWSGILEAVTSDSIVIRLRDGTEFPLGKDAIQEIRRQGDSRENGTLIGAGIGGGVGFAIGICSDEGGCSSDKVDRGMFIGGIGALTGALFGWLSDAAVTGEEVIFVST